LLPALLTNALNPICRYEAESLAEPIVTVDVNA
jgi:hypothetical protein